MYVISDDPTFVRARGAEVLIKQVVRYRVCWVTLCCDLKHWLRTSLKAGNAHQSSHFVATTGAALFVQLSGDLRSTVHTVSVAVDLPNERHQLAIGLRPLTLRPDAPRIIAAARNGQQSAHHPHWLLVAASIDTRVSHFDSLAKKTAASFKKSLSCSAFASLRLR
jgi:hypothetical protein